MLTRPQVPWLLKAACPWPRIKKEEISFLCGVPFGRYEDIKMPSCQLVGYRWN
jgi:hypothetical protein